MTLLELDELGRQRRDRFTLLYRTHYDAILGYAGRRTDPATARDVAAETFLVAWRGPTAIPREPEAVRLWLYGVARRTLANAERSRGRSERVAAKLLATTDAVELAPDLADGVVERARIGEALGSLSALDQETLGWSPGRASTWRARPRLWVAPRSLMAVRLHRPAAGWPGPCARRVLARRSDTAKGGSAQAVEELK